MALVDFGTRVKWRLKGVDRATRATVGDLNESRRFCHYRRSQGVVDFCRWD